MLKACIYCGRIHEKGFVCLKKPKVQSKYEKQIDIFRGSVKWKNKREHIYRRDMYLCRVCLDNGVYCSDNLSVHHITPLASDFSRRLDDDNLITLCGYHHEAAEKGDIPAEYLRTLAEQDSTDTRPVV